MMTFKRFATIFVASTLLFATACNKKTAEVAVEKCDPAENIAYQKFLKNPGNGKNFGATMTAEGAISYDQIRSKMGDAQKMENVKVLGTVEAVCQSKGCWMSIKSLTGAPEMMVKFKDYAFFMPKDIAGKRVVMQGNVLREQTTVAQLRHLAQDEGKTADEIAKINTPREDLKFLASSVIIME
jgi:Domain of unknown function (DUF4920)